MDPRLVQLSAKAASAVIGFARQDLGRKPMDSICAPYPGTPRTIWYPTLWVSDLPKPIDLPDTGKAVVNYKIVSRTSTNRDGTPKHSADIEIHSIEPQSDGKKKKKLPGAAVRIANLAAKLGGTVELSRERNADGEFSPQAAADGPTPQDMARTYGAPRKFHAGAAAAGVSGAGGAALLLRKLAAKRRA